MNSRDRGDLEAFVERAAWLGRSRIFALDRVSTFEISWAVNQPTRATYTEPEEEALSNFIFVLRPLISQKGDTTLYRVLNLCRKHLDDADLLRQLEDMRAGWKAAQKQGPLKLIINDEHWRPEVVAHRIIHAYYAKDDGEKRRLLGQLGAVETMLTRTVFIGYLTQSASAARQIAEVVRIGLGDRRFK